MVPLAMIALAGVLIVAAMRGLLPGLLAPTRRWAAPPPSCGSAPPGCPTGRTRTTTKNRSIRRHVALSPAALRRRRYDNGPDDGRRTAVVRDPAGARARCRPASRRRAACRGMPGQYGRIMIYTLIDGHARGVRPARRRGRPRGTLPSPAPSSTPATPSTTRPTSGSSTSCSATRTPSRRTRWQPHVQQFAREARAHVDGTNVIELTVSAAKVAPPPPARAAGPPPPAASRAPAPGAGRHRPRPQPGTSPPARRSGGPGRARCRSRRSPPGRAATGTPGRGRATAGSGQGRARDSPARTATLAPWLTRRGPAARQARLSPVRRGARGDRPASPASWVWRGRNATSRRRRRTRGCYGEQIPVTFVDGVQHDFWRVDESRLRAALTR